MIMRTKHVHPTYPIPRLAVALPTRDVFPFTPDRLYSEYITQKRDEILESKQKSETLRFEEKCLRKLYESCGIDLGKFALAMGCSSRKEVNANNPSVGRFTPPLYVVGEILFRFHRDMYTALKGKIVYAERKTQSGNSKKKISKGESVRSALLSELYILGVNRSKDNEIFKDAVSYNQREGRTDIIRGKVFVKELKQINGKNVVVDVLKKGPRKETRKEKETDFYSLYDCPGKYINPRVCFEAYDKLCDEANFDFTIVGQQRYVKALQGNGLAARDLKAKSMSSSVSRRIKEYFDEDDFPEEVKKMLPKKFDFETYCLRNFAITSGRNDCRDEVTGKTKINSIDIAFNADHNVEKGLSTTDIYTTGLGGSEHAGKSYQIHMLCEINKYIEEMYIYDKRDFSNVRRKRIFPRRRAPINVAEIIDKEMKIRDHLECDGTLIGEGKNLTRKRTKKLENIDFREKKKICEYPSFPMISDRQMYQPPQMYIQPPRPMFMQRQMYMQPPQMYPPPMYMQPQMFMQPPQTYGPPMYHPMYCQPAYGHPAYVAPMKPIRKVPKGYEKEYSSVQEIALRKKKSALKRKLQRDFEEKYGKLEDFGSFNSDDDLIFRKEKIEKDVSEKENLYSFF